MSVHCVAHYEPAIPWPGDEIITDPDEWADVDCTECVNRMLAAGAVALLEATP